MKYVLLMLVFISLISIVGCVAPQYLTAEDKEVIYPETESSMSKSEIKNKLTLFINDNFKSAKSVIQSNEDGLLTGSFVTQLKCFDLLCYIKEYAEISFAVKYSDNKYKLKLSVKRIFDDNPKGGADYPPHRQGTVTTELKKAYSDFSQMLNDYMVKDNDF